MQKIVCLAVGVALLCVGYVQAEEMPFVELKGHTDTVVYIYFLPDGKKVITVSGNIFGFPSHRTTRIWDVESGQELQKWEGSFTLLSPDRKKIVIATLGVSVTRIWDVESGKELHSDLRMLGEHVQHFTPDGKRMMTVGKDGITRFRDTKSGKELFKFEKFVYVLAFSPNGKKIYTQTGGPAPNDRTIRILDAESGKELETVGWHEGDERFGTEITFSPDGKRLITEDGHGNGRLRNAESGSELQNLGKHFLEFSPDGKRLATMSDEAIRITRIWDAETGKELYKSEAWFHRFSPDGKKFATTGAGHRDGVTRIWDAETGKELLKLDEYFLTFSPDGKRVVTGGKDVATVWNVASGKALQELKIGASQSAAFSPDGKRIVVGNLNDTVRIWTLEQRCNTSSKSRNGAQRNDGRKRGVPVK